MDQHDGPGHASLGRRDTNTSLVDTVLLTAPQHDVVEAILSAVRHGVSLVVVTSSPGSGRSLVANLVTEVLFGQGVRVDRGLPPSGLGREVLLAHAATLLQLDPDLLARAMLPPAPVMVATGLLRVAAMIVDDADAWPPDALRMLLSLARVRLIDGPLLHIILMGQAVSLRPVLSAETLPAHASLRIAPLSLEQSREYLARHLAAIPLSGAGLSERTADKILAGAGGSPGRIDALVRSYLAAQPSGPASDTAPAGRRAAGATSLFSRLAVPAALLTSMLMLGVVATALLPHFQTGPALPNAAGRATVAASLPPALDMAVLERRAGCPPTRGAAPASADNTARGAPLDPSCRPVPDVLAQLHRFAVPLPPPQSGALVDPPLLLLQAPVVIGAERAPLIVPVDLPPLRDLVLPPSLDHVEVLATIASAAGAAAKLGIPPSPRLHAWIAARLPSAAHPPGIASASHKAHMPDRTSLQAQRHNAPLEQPSPAASTDRGGIRDNPDGQVSRAGVPYFCRAIQASNQAETAYIRQVCGR